MTFERLFTPLRIGGHEVRNRVFMSSATLMFSTDGIVSDRHVAYYAERARGGIGLIIPEEIEVHPSAAGAPVRWLLGWPDDSVAGFAKLTGAVHAHGASIFAQLDHAGTIHDPAVFDEPRPAVSASAFGHPGRETPKAMDHEEIAEVVEYYGRCARNAVEGGFDGIEIHCAHGHLPAQFLSPLSNHREDGYGGSLGNRLRFTFEVLAAVRREVPEGFPVGLRLSLHEFAPGGMDLEQTIEAARGIAAEGVDFFDLSAGRPPYSYDRSIPLSDTPPAHLHEMAGRFRAAVPGIPAFVVGRIVDPQVAEEVLERGDADMVGMLRAHIADPEIVNKTREGRLDEIRYCISCNQECFARVANGRPIACIQNPTTGREAALALSRLRPASRPRRVVVVGGGPAGLETAWVAAARGHEVELYEAGDQLGGQARLHALSEGREAFQGLVANLERYVERHGVKVHLGRRVTAEEVRRLDADVVVVATGSAPRTVDAFREWRPDLPHLPGFDGRALLTSWDVMLRTRPIRGRVALLDADGRHEAAAVAETLARSEDVDLDVVTPFPQFLPSLGPTLELNTSLGVVLSAGARIHVSSVPAALADGGLRVLQLPTGAEHTLPDLDAVVVLAGNRSQDALLHELRGTVRELHAVGDCLQPRRIAQAMYQGHTLARGL